MWLLEGPPREEIFPAALRAGARGADSTPGREQRSPALSHRSGPSWPPGLCQGVWTLGSVLAPQPPPCPRRFSAAEHIAAHREGDIFPTRVEREKVLLGQQLAAGSQNTYITNAAASEPFVVSPKLSRDGRMEPLASEGVLPVTDNT